jgi:hypothetical protein
VEEKKMKKVDKMGIGIYLVGAAVSIGAGAYLGYAHSKGLPVEHEFALKYGPTIAHGAVGVPFGLACLVGDGKTSAEGGLAAIFGPIYGAAFTGLGALETAIGYGIGYTAGRMM